MRQSIDYMVHENPCDTKKRYTVKCLEDMDTDHIYLATTPYNALRKARYELSLSHDIQPTEILLTPNCLHFYMECDGKTYAVRND